MSSLSATQSDGYYLPPEYFESGSYKKVSRNRYAVENEASNGTRGGKKPPKVGHNQWLKNGIVRFELPEKAVCLGCKQSVGRGTRFNARKIKTDESYFTTPIFEFRLSCRKCQTPWVIRTDPKERGFAYISGVKRQAGQERNLVEASLGTGDAITASVDGHGGRITSLEKLESATVAKRTFATEIEELAALRNLNQRASADGNDVDHNALIRKTFRIDRREHHRRLKGAKSLGWKKGMTLLPSNESDVLASKEICYGRASATERHRFSRLKKSSIFGRSSRRLKRKRKVKQEECSSEHNASLAPDPVPSDRALTDASSPQTISKTDSSPSKRQPVLKATIKLSNGVVSTVSRESRMSSKTTAVVPGISEIKMDSVVLKRQKMEKETTKSETSFLQLIGGIGSSDEDD